MLTELSQPPGPPANRAGPGTIRPFLAPDSGAVADLLMRAFQNTDRAAPPGMATYLREVYLESPGYDPAVASRVMTDGEGRITGFLGVTSLPMRLDGRRIRAAVLSSLAADPRVADPMIAPRLLRDARNGPQDATLSDRCNAVAVAALRPLGAELARSYSFDWLRVLRPAGFAVETAASKLGALRALAPLARPIDATALGRSLRDEGTRWLVPSRAKAAEPFTDRDAALDELVTLIPQFLADFPLAPDWSAAELRAILNDGARKADLGRFVARVVLDPGQHPAGVFLYHLRSGRIAHVLQLLARRGREGVVIDKAIAHATANGAVAIRGRSYPALTEALMARRAFFVPELAAMVMSRNADLLRHFRDGQAFFTGLAGEEWMRLNGDHF